MVRPEARSWDERQSEAVAGGTASWLADGQGRGEGLLERGSVSSLGLNPVEPLPLALPWVYPPLHTARTSAPQTLSSCARLAPLCLSAPLHSWDPPGACPSSHRRTELPRGSISGCAFDLSYCALREKWAALKQQMGGLEGHEGRGCHSLPPTS